MAHGLQPMCTGRKDVHVRGEVDVGMQLLSVSPDAISMQLSLVKATDLASAAGQCNPYVVVHIGTEMRPQRS